MEYKVIIIGSGPAGYHAAILAAQQGWKTAIIESDEIGGVCSNWGCIPTKALLDIAHNYDFIKNKSDKFGIYVQDVDYDFNEVIGLSRKAANRLSGGVRYLFSTYKNIDVYDHHVARLVSKNEVKIVHSKQENEKTLSAEHIIIATGSSARGLPGIDMANEKVWTYRDALSPKSLPEKMLIVGSGAIGIEFADIYSLLGTEVHLVESQSNILPSVDDEVSGIMHKILSKNFKIYTGANCHIDMQNMSATIKEQKITIEDIDNVLIAIGVVPNVKNIGLENTKIKLDSSNFIITNEHYQTDEDNIYAIGDVSGNPCLAHKGSHEAVVCIQHIMNKNCTHHPFTVPMCIYTNPQVASIGMTEKDARAKYNNKIKVGKSYASSNGKLTATQKSDSFAKIIVEETTGEILGFHMVGHASTEILHLVSTAKYLEATIQELQSMVFAHPTESEMVYEAALSVDNRSVNQKNNDNT